MGLKVYDALGREKPPGPPTSFPVVSSLAGLSPYEGLVVVYQDANMADDAVITGGTRYGGTEWTLRYRAAASSAYKWECIGGGFSTTKLSNASNLALVNGAWTDGGTPGPDWVCPISGDYEYVIGASFTPNGSSGQGNAYIGLTTVGGTPVLGDSAGAVPLNNSGVQAATWTGRAIGLVAGTTYRVRYVATMAGMSVCGVNARQLMIKPVRVG